MTDKEQIQVLYETNLELREVNSKYLDIIKKLVDELGEKAKEKR
jgi:hypothetical protein